MAAVRRLLGIFNLIMMLSSGHSHIYSYCWTYVLKSVALLPGTGVVVSCSHTVQHKQIIWHM